MERDELMNQYLLKVVYFVHVIANDEDEAHDRVLDNLDILDYDEIETCGVEAFLAD